MLDALGRFYLWTRCERGHIISFPGIASYSPWPTLPMCEIFPLIKVLEECQKCQWSFGIPDPGSWDPEWVFGNFLVFLNENEANTFKHLEGFKLQQHTTPISAVLPVSFSEFRFKVWAIPDPPICLVTAEISSVTFFVVLSFKIESLVPQSIAFIMQKKYEECCRANVLDWKWDFRPKKLFDENVESLVFPKGHCSLAGVRRVVRSLWRCIPLSVCSATTCGRCSSLCSSTGVQNFNCVPFLRSPLQPDYLA